ncbi:MAG TPA: DUF5666 domain-containing protein [Candidatus Sulfotelmatobacter sp.]|nr:DUF5666 domain-containing protein [Candidatus Sulfotelmatobacter sp.]
MKAIARHFFTIGLTAILICGAYEGIVLPSQAQEAANPSGIARRIGVIKAINGNTLTLTPDSGSDVTVTVAPNARLLGIAPGAKDLKSATPVQLQDLKVGDRVRVRGQAPDANSLTALEVIVMAQSDLAARHEQERQDWQKRGLGGLVSAVDPATGTVTISVSGLSGKKSIAIHTSKDTIFRRYAPNSANIENATSSSLAEIHPEDQLRARGNRSADGNEFAAEEIVSGKFRNIAGTVNSVDASSGVLTVQDLITKKPVEVKVTGDSQMHQIPAEMAQRIAMRLKASMAGSMPPGVPGGATGSTGGAQAAQGTAAQGGATTSTGAGAGPGGGGMRAGGGDLSQMLSHLPVVALGDLHKGDAVLIVTTEGSANTAVTAINLVSGVEPILQAAPNGSQAMMLTPWSLGGAPGGDAGAQ